MKTFIRSKIFIVSLVSVAVCSFTAGMVLIFAIEPYECTLDDLWSIDPNLPQDIAMRGYSMHDEVTLSIDVPHELGDDEVRQLEDIGVEIADWGHMFPFGIYKYHSYVVNCEISNICRLSDLDFITKIESLEGFSELQ